MRFHSMELALNTFSMEEQSFYSFDYLISINEKRAKQYLTAYQKVIERFTNIILIYSAITIFLIPII